jgi:hypothetical protein
MMRYFLAAIGAEHNKNCSLDEATLPERDFKGSRKAPLPPRPKTLPERDLR